VRVHARFRTLAAGAVLALAAALALVAPASAVTDGAPDGDGHPYVGLMVASVDGVPQWRCSGTLIAPKVFLTAGHCTYGADHVEIWFASDVQSGIPANGYPYEGEVAGTPVTHPDYDPNAFYLRDVGVVLLQKPVRMSTYGALPRLDQLDSLTPQRGQKDVTFTAVGYGLQQAFPDAASWKDQADKVRMVAYPKLDQINTGATGPTSLILSNNTNTGGTCFGDSGGPNFLGTSNVVAGVTSFGMNGTCGGTGGVFRMDRAWSLNWVRTFLR
jgi:secreted trypsin-like serine protease